MHPDTFRWRGDEIRWSRIGSGPPLVLCHGTPWSSALWWPIAEALSARFSTYLWDMAGYGESTMAAGQDVSLGAQGELFGELLTHWGLTGPGTLPHVVAHDYSGAVALRAHLLHGAAYRSLALVDVVALAPWGSDFFRLVGTNSEVFGAIPTRRHPCHGTHRHTAAHTAKPTCGGTAMCAVRSRGVCRASPRRRVPVPGLGLGAAYDAAFVQVGDLRVGQAEPAEQPVGVLAEHGCPYRPG